MTGLAKLRAIVEAIHGEPDMDSDPVDGLIEVSAELLAVAEGVADMRTFPADATVRADLFRRLGELDAKLEGLP